MIILIIICAAAFFIYHIQQRVYCRWWNRNLCVTVDFRRPDLFEGEKGELIEVVENRKRLPLPLLTVKFQADRNLVFSDTKITQVTDRYYRNDVFHIGGGERITRTLTFTGMKRGYYSITNIDMVTSDLFLTRTMAEGLGAGKSIYVYPRPFYSEQFKLSMQQQSGEMLTKQHLQEDPFEHRGIRPYLPCDEMRLVNWKATAKTGELKVNQKNYTSIKSIRIFFNIEDTGIRRKPEAVEASLRITAGLAEHYLGQGMTVACYGNGKDIVTRQPFFIEPGGGSGHMQRIYKALARVDTTQPTADFGQCFGQKMMFEDRGVMTFFVAPNGYDDFTGVVEKYKAAGGDFIWFYPNAEDEPPELPAGLAENTRVITIGKL